MILDFVYDVLVYGFECYLDLLVLCFENIKNQLDI